MVFVPKIRCTSGTIIRVVARYTALLSSVVRSPHYLRVLLVLFPTEAEFVVSLLNIAAIFDFTKDLQDFILHE